MKKNPRQLVNEGKSAICRDCWFATDEEDNLECSNRLAFRKDSSQKVNADCSFRVILEVI